MGTFLLSYKGTFSKSRDIEKKRLIPLVLLLTAGR
jgi:hypothetical protein